MASHLKKIKDRNTLQGMYGGEIHKSQGRPGSSGYNGGSLAAERRTDASLAQAMNNDYDVRRYMEVTGNDSAIGNLEQAGAIHKEMKKRHEGGGAYSSAQDKMNISMQAVDEYEDKRDSGLRKDFRQMLKKNNKKTTASQNTEAAVAPEIGLSDAAKDSQELLAKYTTGITGSTLGRGSFNSADPFDTRGAELGTESPGTTQPGASGVEDVVDESPIDSTNENLEEAMDFKNKYSFNVAQGLNLAGIKTSGKGATKFGS